MLNNLKIRLLLISLSIIFNLAGYGFCEDSWEYLPGIKESDLKEIAVDYENRGVIYVSGNKTLYRTEDSGRNWSIVFSIQAEDNFINFVDCFKGSVFICARKGVFKNSYGEPVWSDIFKYSGEKENNTMHVVFLKEKNIYLSTDNGLFISNDGGISWTRDTLGGAGSGVRWVVFSGGTILAATAKGVYKNSGNGWERTYVAAGESVEYDADAVAEPSEEKLSSVNSLAIGKGMVFLATNSGVFISSDNGSTWKSFSNAGLPSLRVKRILCADSIYASTDKGVFVFSETAGIWENLYKGMDTKDVNSIALDSEGNILAATKKGLYKKRQAGEALSALNADLENKKQDILDKFSGEPGISETQEAAIEYAEVHPDKIKEWRKAAGKKALLPDVSIGLDRYVTDYWHWDSGTNPDTLQKGKDAVCWDVTMTWDMGELIWNSDQTSIDARSKLMVELRDDIMNEVARIYFERRRLQIDMVTSPPQDLRFCLEKELRLQELTADLDALTGGYFSRHIEK